MRSMNNVAGGCQSSATNGKRSFGRIRLQLQSFGKIRLQLRSFGKIRLQLRSFGKIRLQLRSFGKLRLLGLSLLFLAVCASFYAAVPVVSNVTAVQRTDGSKIVDIHYDLYDADNDLCFITVKLSADNGASFYIIPSLGNLSGDCGAGVASGLNKHIVWNAGAESYPLDGDSYLYRVYADDGSSPPMPESFVFVQGGTIYPTTGIYTGGLTVSSFYMDKYELTQAGYQAVMGYNPSYFTSVTNGPVEQASWFNAIEYSNRRSLLEGLTPCYSYSTYGTNPDNWPAGWNTDYNNHTNVNCNWSASGYRLPSEAEWEYAARGGLQTHGYTYSGSNEIDAVAWYLFNSGGTTHTAGTKAPNELGLYDLSGNVSEWCWDVYSGASHVRRGGSWSGDAYYCTVDLRDYNYTTYTHGNLGFRLCRVSP